MSLNDLLNKIALKTVKPFAVIMGLTLLGSYGGLTYDMYRGKEDAGRILKSTAVVVGASVGVNLLPLIYYQFLKRRGSTYQQEEPYQEQRRATA